MFFVMHFQARRIPTKKLIDFSVEWTSFLQVKSFRLKLCSAVETETVKLKKNWGYVNIIGTSAVFGLEAFR